MYLPESQSGRNALSRSVFSEYGRPRGDSSLDRLRPENCELRVITPVQGVIKGNSQTG